MKPITVLTIFSLALFAQVINGEKATFQKLVTTFNERCIEKKVPIKSLDFLVKFAPNVQQIEHNLNVPMKQFMSEDKITEILAHMPDEMTILKMKVETGARDFVHSVIDMINTEQNSLGKLNHEIAMALEFELDSDDFSKAFNHWAAYKHLIKEEYLKKVEGSVDVMKSYYEQLHTKFNEEMTAVEAARSKIEHDMDLANASLAKLFGADTETGKHIVDEARNKMLAITESQTKLKKHLIVLKALVGVYNIERTEWAKYIMGMKDSIQAPTLVEESTHNLKNLKL